jgi:lysophospholipase L1-like esterase
VIAAKKLHDGLAASGSKPCGIVGVGSSTMAGYLLSNKTDAWFSKFIRLVQARHPAPDGTESTTQYSTTATFTRRVQPGVHGYSAGQASTTSADYVWSSEIAKIKALDPRGVIHMVGSNDMAAGVPPSKVRSQILYRLDEGWSQGWCSHIYVHQHRRNGSFAYPWSQYRDVWQGIAQERPTTVGVIDVSDEFAAIGIPGNDTRSYLQADGIHLEPAGHTMMARLVFGAIMPRVDTYTDSY